jgi:hypothetical protein
LNESRDIAALYTHFEEDGRIRACKSWDKYYIKSFIRYIKPIILKSLKGNSIMLSKKFLYGIGIGFLCSKLYPNVKNKFKPVSKKNH